jgi:hemoglobin
MNDPFKEFGEAGFVALSAAFYRWVATDDVVGYYYHPDRLKIAEGRLADFLVYRFGGSDKYITEGIGHDFLGMHHHWTGITPTVRNRWLEMMSAAMDEVGLTGPPRQRLEDFFTDISNVLVNDDGSGEPDGGRYKAQIKRLRKLSDADHRDH